MYGSTSTQPMKLRALPSPLTALVTMVVSAIGLGAQTDAYYDRIHSSMESFGAVFREITTDYVDRTNPDAIVKAGIKGMLKELDPYSVFMDDADDMESVERLSTGSYVGFGFSVSPRNGVLTITDLRPGYSAEQAGIRLGDRLVSVNLQRVDSLDLDSLRDVTHGPEGSNALLSFVRDGRPDTITVNLVRRQMPLVNVTLAEMLDESVAYVKLERFSRDAGRELRWTLDEMQEQHPVSAVILDLRGNPGGLLEAAVDVCEIFLPMNTLIVSTRDRLGRTREYWSDREPLMPSIPLTILIDEHSASASEIVAGAIQDHDRGVLIGTRSFGKGLVQTVVPLPNESSLKLTTARYYTPSGRCIQKLYRPDPDQDSTGSFTTRKGRMVRPSSGIYPDVELAQAPYPAPIDHLLKNNVVGEFATRYTANRKELPATFKVDKSVLQAFAQFVDSLPAQRRSGLAGSLQTVLDDMVAAGSPRSAIVSVRTALAAMKTDDKKVLDTHQEHLIRLLDAEIRSRFSTDAERLRRLLAGDTAVNAARDILSTDRYDSVLGGDSRGDQ